jgi:phage host-nuclease inhibitor protein Gam
MNNRLKPSLIIPKTREEAESIVGSIAEQKISESRTKALMDQRLKEVREDHEAQLAYINDKLTPLLMRIQAWAESNAGDFGKLKSIEMIHGTIGWRVSPPTLKTLSGWTWQRVLDALKSLGHAPFIRTKEEVDKQAVLAQRENLLDGDLRQFGCKIVQEESFFVEPKTTPTESRVMEATV